MALVGRANVVAARHGRVSHAKMIVPHAACR
jgi:hypothetical protein